MRAVLVQGTDIDLGLDFVGIGTSTQRGCNVPEQRNVTPFPAEHWAIYRCAMDCARDRGLRFALGGAIGLAAYTGQWRYTKDLDLYIAPESRESMICVLSECGLTDYYQKLAYDRGWIYRGNTADVIVDVIWGMPNRRAQVDEHWLTQGLKIEIHGEWLRVLPPEAVLWAKLFVMQRERCDWPDILNLLYAAGASMDWEWLLHQVGSDVPILAGVLSIFRWLAPNCAANLPKWLWRIVRLPQPEKRISLDEIRHRAFLLDTRPWFLPVLDVS